MKFFAVLSFAGTAILCCGGAFAQHKPTFALLKKDSTAGWYVKASVIPHFFKTQIGNADVPYHREIHDPRTGQTTEHNGAYKDRLGIGKAFSNFGITAGYNVNRYLAVELAFNYASNYNYFLIANEEDMAVGDEGYAPVAQKYDIGYLQGVSVAPSITVSPAFKRVNPYLRVGLELPAWLRVKGIAGSFRQNVVNDSTIWAVSSYRAHETIKPAFHLGVQGAVGVKVNVIRHFSVFGELAFRSMAFYGKSATKTSYYGTATQFDPDGKPIDYTHRTLSDISTAEKETHYVKTLGPNANVVQGVVNGVDQYKDNNRPADEVRGRYNIGYLAINAGIQYTF